MKNSKKLSLWILLIGMLCIPAEQADARMSSNFVNATIVASISAAAYLTYVIYYDYCKAQAKNKKNAVTTTNDPMIDGQESELLFDEYLGFLRDQFKDEKLASDFDIRIFTLLMNFYSKGTKEISVEIIEKMKKLAHEQSTPINIKHLEDIIIPDDEKNNNKQALLDKAYHQAAHAVAVIELMNPNMALYNVTLHALDTSFGGFLVCPLVKDISDEDTLIFFEDSIMYYLAGGIGEQLFNVSPSPRFHDDFDMNQYDKDSDDYEYIDMVTRQSVAYNMENVASIADQLLYFNCIDAGNSERQCLIIDPIDRQDLILDFYEKIQKILVCNKDKIKKLAELLVKKGTVYADEAYAICGKKRPLFYFEKE